MLLAMLIGVLHTDMPIMSHLMQQYSSMSGQMRSQCADPVDVRASCLPLLMPASERILAY